jgi:hypothetical protein
MRSRTYRFGEKDPVCGEIMSMVDQVGLRGKQHVAKIAILATKAKSTIEGILYGDTMSPHNATVMSIATALGFERTWTRGSKNFNVEAELKAAREYIKRERARMAEGKPKKKARKRRAKERTRKQPRLKPALRLVA